MTLLEWLIVILIVMWLGGMFWYPIGGWIHILIVIAVVLFLIRLISGRRRTI